jgi:hypothetical protein
MMGILTLEFNFYEVRIKCVNYFRKDGKFGFKDNIPNIIKPMVYGVHCIISLNITKLHW